MRWEDSVESSPVEINQERGEEKCVGNDDHMVV